MGNVLQNKMFSVPSTKACKWVPFLVTSITYGIKYFLKCQIPTEQNNVRPAICLFRTSFDRYCVISSQRDS